MEIDPYSIYVNQRPPKVAFLVDPAEGRAWIDRIFAFNREKWGGRFNSIFLTDGASIEDHQWRRLRDYDPDIIKSTVVLCDDLRKHIRTFLSPFSVESVTPGDDNLYLSHDPISLLPDRRLISQIARDFSDQQSQLVLFDVAENAPTVIRDFIERNFGLLKPDDQVFYIKRALDDAKTSTYPISDQTSLNEALLELGDYRRVVFPAQLCSLPNFLKDIRYDREAEHFAVIVGDSIDELTYFWNRALAVPHWLRTGITQLWLPIGLASEPGIRPGLTKFLSRFVDSTGNQNQHAAHFVSFSLKEEELRRVSESFGGGIRYAKTSSVLSHHPVPKREEGDPFLLKPRLELHRAHASEEHLVLSEPSVPEGSVGGQMWVVDVAIQFRPERFANIIGKDYWWRLPQRNSVLAETRFFNRPARVRADRGFSVLMTRRSAFGPDESTLIVRLPDDFSVAHALICGERFDHYQSDEKSRELSRPFDQIERSDKGMYLSGVLSLFPDLLNAHALFEARFWRRTFARMANQRDRKDTMRKLAIVNKLKKQLPDWENFGKDDDRLEWWAERVLAIAKDYSKEEKELPFEEFCKDAVDETKAYNELQRGGPVFEVDEDEFRSTISGLLAWKVLLQGIRPKCPRCGYRIWYNIGDISQTIPCAGCGYAFSVSAEERWYYRLNSLVRAAVSSHGTVPLLLVLGQLMHDARTSFTFSPCLNLFRRSANGARSYDHVGELDLICIVDGRFTIGEVKNSVGLFGTNDFDALATIAKVLKPDVLLFSALDGTPTNAVKKNIDRIRKELAPLEIDVKWFPLRDWVSEPRPVR